MGIDAIWLVVQWVLIGLGSVLGVVVLLALVGCFYASEHIAGKSLRSKRSPEEIWAIITDFAAVPSWHPEVGKVEQLPDRQGHAVWRETDKRGYPIELETAEAVAPTKLVRRIADVSGPFTGTWTFDLAAEGKGTRVTLTEHGRITNPLFRLMFRTFMTPTFYLELYLKALAAKLGDQPVLDPKEAA